MSSYRELALVFFLFTVTFPSASQEKGVAEVKYCDLIAAPERYDGVRISIFAVYNYGFEWQELLCMECRKVGRLTWLEFDAEHEQRYQKEMRKAPKEQGVIAARFVGVFRRRTQAYGGYAFELNVEEVSGVRVLIRDHKTPLSRVPPCCKLI